MYLYTYKFNYNCNTCKESHIQLFLCETIHPQMIMQVNGRGNVPMQAKQNVKKQPAKRLIDWLEEKCWGRLFSESGPVVFCVRRPLRSTLCPPSPSEKRRYMSPWLLCPFTFISRSGCRNISKTLHKSLKPRKISPQVRGPSTLSGLF